MDLVLVDIRIHDASRFEWRVAIPLPRHGRSEYVIDAEFELPSNAVSGRSPWDQIQGLTRLEGASVVGLPERQDAAIGALHGRVLELQQMLANRTRLSLLRRARGALPNADRSGQGQVCGHASLGMVQ
jgi:hypothetical protein